MMEGRPESVVEGGPFDYKHQYHLFCRPTEKYRHLPVVETQNIPDSPASERHLTPLTKNLTIGG